MCAILSGQLEALKWLVSHRCPHRYCTQCRGLESAAVGRTSGRDEVGPVTRLGVGSESVQFRRFERPLEQMPVECMYRHVRG
jgi:hypothetical protein